MIYLIGEAPDSSRYRTKNFMQFGGWLGKQTAYQLDIETNVTPWWCDKKLITLQFGSMDGQTQWVIQWSYLDNEEKRLLKAMLEDAAKLKVIHNGMFECVVLLFYGIRIVNIFDTMLAEMVLYCGMEFKTEEIEDDETEEAAGFYALTSLTYRYLGRGMDKREQMNFGDNILTESKVVYAATDVMHLGAIRRMQLPELSGADLEYVMALENAALPGFAEMTFEGMELNQDAWKANEQLALPIIAKAKSELDEYLKTDPVFRPYALEKMYFSESDMICINWNSPPQKKKVVEHFFPFLQDKHSKAVLTNLLKGDGKLVMQADGSMSVTSRFSDPIGRKIAQAFLDKNWTYIETVMIGADKHWLIDNHFLIPAGETTINWNSRDQVLPLFKLVKKGMTSLDEESMDRFHHPIGTALSTYKDTLKLLTTYGQAFISGNGKKKLGNVEPDGKVRTSFNQIVSTGRVSSRRPNMQNIPVETVGTRYRNAFICDPGWTYVSSDFTGQELTIIAYLSQDPVWLRCLRTGEDIHSVCSELVYPNKQWEKAAEAGCAYYKLDDKGHPLHHKCKCKKHEALRYKVKRLNFGLAYGMGPGKLSGMIKVKYHEAEQLIMDYFKVFPKIRGLLNYLGQFGVKNGYITTLAPFFRKRYFPYWKYSVSNIPTFLAGQFDSQLAAIEREAKNMPIQGSGGDMCKLALVLIYEHIHEHNLPVKLKMQVHDQLDTVATEEYAAEWVPIMDRFMREAASVIIPDGLLTSETTISPVWTK